MPNERTPQLNRGKIRGAYGACGRMTWQRTLMPLTRRQRNGLRPARCPRARPPRTTDARRLETVKDGTQFTGAGLPQFLVRLTSCEASCCGWCHCLDHAGLRKLVVISAALQLVVVTALYRQGKPPCALEASLGSGSVCAQGCPAV